MVGSLEKEKEGSSMDDQDVINLKEIDLIDFVHHNLRQSSTIALGLVEILTSPQIAYSSPEQEELLLLLRKNIEKISSVQLSLSTWLSAHNRNL